jgi:SAM-dependent methyltransferase
MSRAETFYNDRHAVDATFSGAEYHMKSLLSLRAIKEWGASHSGRQVRLVDVGCGKGVFLRGFVREIRLRWQIQQVTATGIDIVRSSNDVFSEIAPDFKFLQQDLDGHPLPLADSSQDFISCNQVLEHIFATEILLREFHRVLAPGGICLVSVPNVCAWVNRLLFLFGGQPLGSELGTEKVTYGFWPASMQSRLEKFRPSGHIRDFTPRGLRDLTVHCGFKTVGWWSPNLGLVARLGKWGDRAMGIVLRRGDSYPR